jgi:uncharacterized protein (TIGR02118 family)
MPDVYRLTVEYDAPSDPASFDESYDGRHVPLCHAVPGLAGLSVSRPRPVGDGPAPYLVAQLDFADVEAFRTAMRSPEMAAVAEDADALPATRRMFTGDVTTG